MEVVGELGRGGDLAGSSGSTASAAWLSGIDVDSFSSAMAPPGSPPSRTFSRGGMRVRRRFGRASWGDGCFWLAASSSKQKRLVAEYARDGTGTGRRERDDESTTSNLVGRSDQVAPRDPPLTFCPYLSACLPGREPSSTRRSAYRLDCGDHA